jgi:hypothetical protein
LVEVWASVHEDQRGADAIDAQLHGERITPRSGERIVHTASFDDLPDGTFVLESGEPWLVLGDQLLRWTPNGYGEALRRPRDTDAWVVTPPSLVALLRHDREPLVPLLHPSAVR